MVNTASEDLSKGALGSLVMQSPEPANAVINMQRGHDYVGKLKHLWSWADAAHFIEQIPIEANRYEESIA